MIGNVMTAVFNVLKGNAPLMANLGGVAGNGYKIYHVIAPQDAEEPCITFGHLVDTPIGVFGQSDAIEDIDIWVNIWGNEDNAASGVLATYALLDNALDGAALTITGYTTMDCRRSFVSDVNFDLDTRKFSISCRYRVMADKT